MRQRVVQGLRRLIYKGIRNKTHNTHMTKLSSIEKKVTQNLQRKLEDNNLMITKADKGNTLIIILKNEYHLKIHDL
jgi:hypothetical protein